jgi:methanogenic corrinoid protein MtbC1
MNNDDSSSGAAAYGCSDAVADAGRHDTFSRTLRHSGSYASPQRAVAPRKASLVNTIEGEVVPRLMLSRRRLAGLTPAPTATDVVADPADLDELTRLLLQHEVGVAKRFVRQVRERGLPLESVCLGLLAPAARRLGRMWEEDLCDFATVTVGLCHLHEALREVGCGSRTETADGAPASAVLLTPLPGEQHTFGLLMVAEFFRRNGWSVTTEYPATGAELLELVNSERYALVGLTVGRREQLDGLSSRITQIRRASRNRSIGVMLGGRIFTEQPELAARLGADATGADARAAAYQADSFVRMIG